MVTKRDRIKGYQAHVIQLIQMSENAKNGGGDHLIEAEADEGTKPSPKQKTEFVNQQKRNEDRPENPATAAAMAP